MFVKEITLNIDYMREQLEELKVTSEKAIREITAFGNQLLNGINYYRDLSGKILKRGRETFLEQLDACEQGLKMLMTRLPVKESSV